MKHIDRRGVITPVLLAVILLLLRTQGALHHFTNGHSKIDVFTLKGHAAAESMSPKYEPEPVRVPRQLMGGDPQAYTSNIYGDTHRFAQTFYSGEGSKVIFVLTYNGQREDTRFRTTSSELYRSTDYGRTFQNESNKLQPGFQLHGTIYRFPNNTGVIFSDTSRSMIYITTDEGETFSSRRIPVNPRTLKIHPSLSGWILGHDPFQGVLMYSKDSGTSWDIVAQNVGLSDYRVNDFVWGKPGIDWDINNPRQSDITKVFYSVIDRNAPLSSNNSRILYVANNIGGGGYVSKLFDLNLRHFNSFLVDGIFIFASQVVADEQYELYISHKRKPFNLARFPTSFSHFRYFVTSHRSSQALVIIEHENINNLYLSDETGIYYSLSLENLAVRVNDIQHKDYSVDLVIIDSINGTMMANQLTVVSGQKRNQTMITFSNGAQWDRIAAPKYVDGKRIRCHLPTCSLHFHMGSSKEYSQLGVYSRNSAPGIIVAHGNYGPYLRDSGSVYITRNGGLTWEKTLDSTWHVKIIDHGGLLVAAKDNHQDNSRTIRYSCNEGMSWSDFAFARSPIVVWGILTEPGETTTQVLLYGTKSRTSSSTWIITHINFTSIFQYSCQALDYYNWTVSDGRSGNQQCLLGETRIIERRKPGVCCWNSRQYERIISTTPCECTAADFECEWGYRRGENSRRCTLDPKCGPDLDCLTGYRKIAGDVCFGGVSSQYLSPRDCVSDLEYSSRCGRAPKSSIDDNSSDDNNRSGIILPIVIVVVAIILVSIIIASIYCIKKWKGKLCADEPAAMQKADEGPPPKPTKNRKSFIWIVITSLRQPSKLYSDYY